MFTIKFYSDNGYRQKILEAESFTILRDENGAEITLHQKNQNEDRRIDIVDTSSPSSPVRPEGWPPAYQKAIIENSAGKTTEIISAMNLQPLAPRASQFDDIKAQQTSQIGSGGGANQRAA